jgi:DNA-directed RNA polymerase specialized sigma24 family protein
MEQPKGRTHLSETERSMIRQYRLQGYSLEQIARFVKRSVTSVKRTVYDW